MLVKCLDVYLFYFTVVEGRGEFRLVKREVVTPTDRSKSVRNRCVIELFGGVSDCDFAVI